MLVNCWNSLYGQSQKWYDIIATSNVLVGNAPYETGCYKFDNSINTIFILEDNLFITLITRS